MEQADNLNVQPADDELDIELTDTHVGNDSDTSSVQIDFDAFVRQQILEFSVTDTSRELGGVLIGTLQQQGKPLVQVTAMIPARYTDAHNASITFTHETWQDILAIKDRTYPNQKIVGWFHTHPGFGIFLSRFDLHIHENFFNLDWQIAYVVDPLAHTEGFFRWENGKVQKTLDFKIIGELPIALTPFPTPTPTQFPIIRPIRDWRYYVIVGLLAGLVYIQFFRPPKTIIIPPRTITQPSPMIASDKPPPTIIAQPVTSVASANPVDNVFVYIVQPNDSLWSISKRCYGDGSGYSLIQSVNKLKSSALTAGMQLRLPIGILPKERTAKGNR